MRPLTGDAKLDTAIEWAKRRVKKAVDRMSAALQSLKTLNAAAARRDCLRGIVKVSELKQDAIARQAGISGAMLSEYLSGARVLTMEMYQSLVAAVVALSPPDFDAAIKFFYRSQKP